MDPITIGRQIRARRVALGLTLREAAPRCGLSYSMLAQIEKGQATTTPRLHAIRAGLGMDAAEAVPDDRAAIMARFRAVLPHIPEEELDVFIHELALWEKRYLGSST